MNEKETYILGLEVFLESAEAALAEALAGHWDDWGEYDRKVRNLKADLLAANECP
ncbi:MAG: hypothetical protein ACYDB1_13130 [Acidiferrobacteraceae bacterium]